MPVIKNQGGGKEATAKAQEHSVGDYIFIDERVIVEENPGVAVQSTTSGTVEGQLKQLGQTSISGISLLVKKARKAFSKTDGKIIVIRAGVLARVGKAAEIPSPGDGVWTISSQDNKDPRFAYIGGKIWDKGEREGVIQGLSYHSVSYCYVYEALKLSSIQSIRSWQPDRGDEGRDKKGSYTTITPTDITRNVNKNSVPWE